MKFKRVDGGRRLLRRAKATTMHTAITLAGELIDECPVDHYPWRVEVQKDPKGSRYYVTVSFQQNRG